MILLKRLENFAMSKSYFSHLQFGFKKSVGCLEASFVISESVNHKLNKVFSCFLDVKQAFDTVWVDGLFYTLLTYLGVCGKMWLRRSVLENIPQNEVARDLVFILKNEKKIPRTEVLKMTVIGFEPPIF